jgi:hypothetical protein
LRCGGADPQLLVSAPKYTWVKSQINECICCEDTCIVDCDSSSDGDVKTGGYLGGFFLHPSSPHIYHSCIKPEYLHTCFTPFTPYINTSPCNVPHRKSAKLINPSPNIESTKKAGISSHTQT